MRCRRQPCVCPLAALLFALLPVGCADDATGEVDANMANETSADAMSPTASNCAIGELEGGQFHAWPEGSDAELVVGYQGYLFVHVQVADRSGELLKPNVRMTAECEDLAPSVTTRWRADMSPSDDGSTVSELIELWLYPALRDSFIGKSGRLSVELEERGMVCKAAVHIRYVDDELCMHYEDGSIKCKD